MRKCDENREEITLGVYSGEAEIKPEHEASDDVDGYCTYCEDQGISACAYILCLHLNCLDIDLYQRCYSIIILIFYLHCFTLHHSF